MMITDQRLQETLLSKKLFSEKELHRLLLFGKNQRLSLEEVLLEKNVFSDQQLGQLISASFKLPFIALSQERISDDTLQIIPERIARKYKVIAFDHNARVLNLATSNPHQEELFGMITQKTGQKILLHFATQQDIDKTLQLYKKDLQQMLERLLRGGVGQRAVLADAPIAKIVDLLITYAYRENASDIHIEPEEEGLLVRFRIDSVLHDVLTLNKNLHGQIVTRIKVLSKLQTDQHLAAQDGKMRLFIDEVPLDIRVSILPITEGEKIVMRLLSANFKTFSLAELGMQKEDIKKVTKAISKTYGMILSTGPTGSGKTTSIYALLKSLNTREKNITTIEDPVEYRIKGVNQIQVNSKTNLSFASGLRSILRQDPNIIFVGEIRDSETAGIAVNAALTGHLVLSTLHTNDAATALPRLMDMKVEPFLVASTVHLIIAQRLVRQICTGCKSEMKIPRLELVKNMPERLVSKFFGLKREVSLYIGKGCKLCHFTGFDGRIGIFEVIEVSEAIKTLIIQKQDSNAIELQAIRDGMTTMLEDGLRKAAEGVTSLEEVLRVVKTESFG